MAVIKIIEAMRPAQWTKNFFLFAALIFARKFFDWPSFLKAAEAFLLYCLLSGSLYLFNDFMDLKEDRAHPIKSRRPLASGAISSRLALFLFLAGSFPSSFLGS